MKYSIDILDRKNVILIIVLIALFLFFSLSFFSPIVLFVILALLIISYDIKNAYCLLVFTFPYYGVAVIDGNGFIPFLAFLLIIKAFVHKKIKFKKDKFNKLLLFLLVSIFISFLINPIYISSLIKLFFQIILVILLRKINLSQNFYLKLIFFFVLGSVLSILVGFNLDNYTEIWIDKILTTRFIGSVSDPNYFSRLLLFAISSCFILILNDIKKNIKLIVLVCLLFSIFGVFLSLSKMGILIFFIVSAVFFYNIFRKDYFKVSSKFWTLVFLFCIAYAFILNFDFSNIIFRWTNNTGSVTTGRFELQTFALNKWVSSDLINLLFGYGIDSSKILTRDLLYVEANVLHSIYAQTVIEQGILGLIIFIFLFIYFLSNLNTLNVLLLLVFITSGFALSGFFYWDLIFFYLIFDNINIPQKIKKWSQYQ